MRPRACSLALALVLLAAAPAAAQAYYGAIAVNPFTGRYGVSYDYNTAAGAKHRALRECHQQKCRIAVWVRNGYAALVLKHNGVFVAGAGNSKHSAFARARHRAHEQSARSITWVFSG
jgi:uncharacterized protein DUF4189